MRPLEQPQTPKKTVKLILNPHPEGGLVTPNGTRMRLRHRVHDGKQQFALIGFNNKFYSPIFPSLEEYNRWLAANTNIKEFIALPQQNQEAN